MKKSISIFITFLIVSSFGIGLITGVYKTFPYEYFDDAKKIILSEPDIEIDSMNAHVYDVNVSSLIKIENKSDIIQKRNSIIQYVWNSEHLPKIFPEIDKDITDFRYNDFNNLKRIDRVTVNMDYDINSIAYHFIPENSIDKLIIYHQGHGGDFYNGKNTIEFFLENGYSVLAFSMPLMGMNNQPLVEIPNLGTIILKSHNHLKFLEIFNEKPIKFFIEPITASINYVDEYYDYKSIHMIGLSGGGWTTVVYSAIDPRIIHSYSVAGSYPLFMQSSFKQLSDYEVVIPEFYQIANYLELYVMASYGEDRKLVQIFNEFDKCCWSGDSFKIYENKVKNVTYNIGNSEFDIWLDSTHKDHKISEQSLHLILNSLENN
jgi:pimeloyl-ACP methyl ester carboxylesterase